MSIDLSKLRHARSKKDFPEISLEEDEYVVLKILRSPLITIFIWTVVALAAIALIALSILVSGTKSFGFAASNSIAQSFLLLVLLIVGGVVLIAALTSVFVYNQNRILVTNKRIMQQTKTSLFAGSTKIIDLVSIEDVSFKQDGLLEHLLRMGTLRMSTVGDETTYTMKYVDTPKDELDTITHLVHVAKNELENKNA